MSDFLATMKCGPSQELINAISSAVPSAGPNAHTIAKLIGELLARHGIINVEDISLLSLSGMKSANEQLEAALSRAPFVFAHKLQEFFEQHKKKRKTDSDSPTPPSSASKPSCTRNFLAERLLHAFQHARKADYKPAIEMFFASDKPARFHEHVKVDIAECEVVLFCPSCTNKHYKFNVPSSGSLSVSGLLKHLRNAHGCEGEAEDAATKEAGKETEESVAPPSSTPKKRGPLDTFITAYRSRPIAMTTPPAVQTAVEAVDSLSCDAAAASAAPDSAAAAAAPTPDQSSTPSVAGAALA